MPRRETQVSQPLTTAVGGREWQRHFNRLDGGDLQPISYRIVPPVVDDDD
jgi:hypothetical protein